MSSTSGDGLQSALNVEPYAVPAPPQAIAQAQPQAQPQVTYQAIPQEAPQAFAQATPVAAQPANPYQTPVASAPASIQYAGQTQEPVQLPKAAIAQPVHSFAAPKPDIIQLKPRESKTYLINGLGSSVKAIGYGFSNLSKKIPNSELYNYVSFIESSTIIRRNVTKKIKADYRRNPNIEINLIGISFGANIVTLISNDLSRANIPVNYLATMDGPAMVPVRDNVAILDNFTCSGLSCFRTKSRLARGNRTTKYASYKMATNHIPLANDAQVHSRILGQLEASRQPVPVSVALEQ